MYNIFFVINHASKKAHISTTIKTLYPIIKTNGAGMGFTLNRKEPAMRPKMKRSTGKLNAKQTSKSLNFCTLTRGMRKLLLRKAWRNIARSTVDCRSLTEA